MFLQHNRSCSVFVGNIPYDVNEDQLKQIFSQVGPVVSFRLMHDKATGRPKGFGFCEYSDQDTAYAAMRNLNNVECSGRPLRVDWADHELRNTEGVQRAVQRGGNDPARAKVTLNNEILNIFKSKMVDENTTELSYDVQTFAEISSLVTQMETTLLFELIGHAQRFVKQFPEAARECFSANPSISLALCQIAYLLGLTSSPVLPMTPEDIIYSEERIQVLREKGLAPEKPHEMNSAHFLSSISSVLTDTRGYGGLVGAKVLAAGASVAGVRATTIGTVASVESTKSVHP